MVDPMRTAVRSRLLLLVALVLLSTAWSSPAQARPLARWSWPLEPVPNVVRYFQAPTSPFGPGHRGIDLGGTVGQSVLAVADGTVSFTGSVAGRGVVVVDHGALTSTYQPVLPTVPVGAAVGAGQVIGLLELVHSHCLPDACLHLGAKRGDSYLDPLTLLGARPVRLKPLIGLPGSQPPFPSVGLLPQPPAGLPWGQARGCACW